MSLMKNILRPFTFSNQGHCISYAGFRRVGIINAKSLKRLNEGLDTNRSNGRDTITRGSDRLTAAVKANDIIASL